MKKLCSNNERQWLKKAIKRELIPAFKQLGFKEYPLPDDSKNIKSMVIGYPFGILRRNSPKGIDILEIEFDMPGRFGFRFCFATVPDKGYKHPIAGLIAIENIIVSISLKHYFEAYQSRFFRKWFSLLNWPGKEINEADYELLIKKVIEKIIPEIEEVFKTGKVGPHIHENKLITRYILKKDKEGRALEYIDYNPDRRVVSRK